MREGWVRKSISEICDKASSNIAQNKIADMDGDYPVYGASGYVQNVDFYHRDTDYIGIVKDGSGVGRVNVYPAYSSLLGTMQYIIPKDGYLLRYVAYALKGLNLSSFASGAAIPHIYFKDYGKCKIDVPPLSEQQRIVSELDLLSCIIEKKKAQLKEYDQLAQSIFYDMFGDPVTNEKGWDVEYFGDIASFKNGLNYHPKEDGFQIKCIGVGDFQDYRELRDFKLIKDYSIDEVIDESYYLKDGDIIIVRSNGSKELVGRNMIVYPQDKKVTYSGFCIRCRLNSLSILPVVLNRILSDKGTMMVLRQEGRGCNISNINQKILSSLPIILPPLPLQQSFASKIEAIERQKALIQQSIAEVQMLFDSRMDDWFA